MTCLYITYSSCDPLINSTAIDCVLNITGLKTYVCGAGNTVAVEVSKHKLGGCGSMHPRKHLWIRYPDIGS